ncbi:sensor histidine kinase [Streptococcus sp. DD10]|uniref:sensor histidine kinase n=1 Tax=Streptococcus sp. DD10 TaxID=1777878 RepID=UPI0018D3E146|nr:GHKL domain-containing protein [Streptococcus sp. DD10]
MIYIVLVCSYSLGETDRFDSFGSILATICFMAFFVLMFYVRGRREDYENKEELERQKKNQENLQSYTDKIVSLYNEVRGFRHDFAGMVTSLSLSIDSGDLEEIKAIHRDVLETANSHLGAEKFTIFELNNIGDNALRSVLMDKAIKAEEYGLNLTLDIKDYIGRLPIQMLDLVRMTNIIFDNALEGAYDSYSKEVVISVIDLPNRYVIVVKNSRKRGELRYEDVYEIGYSTKGRHRGLGLPTVKKIIDNYENILLDTEITKDFFTQVISIEKEGIF